MSNFYSDVRPNGELDHTAEYQMQRLESTIMPTLRYHIEARRRISPPLPYDAFVTFVATLICRNPYRISDVKSEVTNRLLADLKTDFTSPEAFQNLRADFARRTGRSFPNLAEPQSALKHVRFEMNHFASVALSMLQMPALTERLGTAQIIFLCAPDVASFVTGDVPYLAYSDSAGTLTTLCVPLSPRTAAVFSWKAEPKYAYLDIDRATVLSVNSDIINASREYVICSSKDALDGLLRS
jgi:hypothetical protein